MADILSFRGALPPRFEEAFAEIGPLLGFALGTGGKSVELFNSERLVVEKSKESIRIGYQKTVHVYRALSLLRGEWGQEGYIEECPCFETGVMFDVSRNAVLKPETIRELLRRMALMGVDVGMMYTEDTYEVPGEPYFGYQRGRYSIQEIREIDDYADLFGIELIPCIQTLGHLNRILHWPSMACYADNAEVLLADDEKVYELLTKMIKAASTPYRSKKIHIGMDEAHGIGLGAHLRKKGYEDPHTIIHRHLLRVKEITDELGLQPMMWSDMYFRPDSPTNGYYDSGEPTVEAIKSVVPGVDLIYWDYYHNTEEEYNEMLRKHQKLSGIPLFAGGIWTWTGPAPDYEKTLKTTVPALTACKKVGVPFVLAAAWGDNGAEANFLTALPGIQLYAEFAYRGRYDKEWLEKRFALCCEGDIKQFFGLSRFNTVPGMKATSLRPVNTAKFMLYQDPMVQLFAKDTEGYAMASHYKKLAEEYENYAASGGIYATLMNYYAKLARVLSIKCHWHEEISAVIKAGNKEYAEILAKELASVSREAEQLRCIWRDLWLAVNKPYGFEILDGRMGAVCARLNTASVRVLRWVEGDETEQLPELLEDPLPYTLRDGGTLFGSYAISEIVSACKIDL